MENEGCNEYYEEIDLREIFLQLWDNRWPIVAITFSFLLFSVIYSFYIVEPVYETGSEIYAPDFKLINETEMGNNEYLSFFRKPELKQELIDKYNLEMNKNEIDNKLIVENNKDTNNVILKLRDTDNAAAANLLNDWISLFRLELKKYINEINTRYINNVEILMNEREEAYLQAENKLLEFERNNNLELVKIRLDNKNKKVVDLESKVSSLENNIMVLEDKGNILAEQFQKTEKFIITNETLDNSSMKVLTEILEDKSSIQNLVIRKESINNIYLTIQKQLNQVELDLSSQREELQLLENDIERLNKEIIVLKELAAEMEGKKNLLKLRMEETKRNYQNSKDNYDSLLQKLKENDYTVSIIRKAVVPENPISPNKKLNLAIAGVLGLFLGIFVVFFKNFFTEDNVEMVA